MAESADFGWVDPRRVFSPRQSFGSSKCRFCQRETPHVDGLCIYGSYHLPIASETARTNDGATLVMAYPPPPKSFIDPYEKPVHRVTKWYPMRHVSSRAMKDRGLDPLNAEHVERFYQSTLAAADNDLTNPRR